MMLIALTEKQWLDLITAHSSSTSIFDDPAYLAIHPAIFKVEIAYHAWAIEGELQIATAVYHQQQRIVNPHHFGYQNILITKPGVDSTQQLQDFTKALSKTYKSISWKLMPSIMDTRPMTWNGFSSQAAYTLVKNTNDLSYQGNIHRYIQKAEKTGIEYRSNTDTSATLAFHQADLAHFGVNPSKQAHYTRYFEALITVGMMQTYNAYLENKLIGSILAITDQQRGTAYLIMISRSEGYYPTGVQSGLYHYTFQQLQQMGCTEVDLCGANIPGIAKFKASFYPQLTPYYRVEYSSRLWDKCKQAVRLLLK